MASDKIKKELNEITGWINAFQTLIDRNQLSRLSEYGINPSITNWLANGGELTQTIDIIQLLYLIIGDRDWETFLMETLTTFVTPEWLETIEDVIKKSLIGILASLLSCDINPIIPDKLIMAGSDCLGGQGKPSDGEGYTIPLSVIDMMGSLFLSPTDKIGKYNYFDVRNSDKIYFEYDEKIAIDYINSQIKLVSNTSKDEDGYIFEKRILNGRLWGENTRITDEEKTEGKLKPTDKVFYRKSDRNRLCVQTKLEKRIVIESNDAFKVITVLSLKDENGEYRKLEGYGDYSGRNTGDFLKEDGSFKNMTDILNILNEYGVLFMDVPDTLWKEKSTVNVNTLWQSHDFNAFLWYVINRGIPNSETEKWKCVWDNRYSAYKKITKNSDRDTSLHKINSLGDEFYDAKTDCEVQEYNGTGDTKVRDVTIQLNLEEVSLYSYKDKDSGNIVYTTNFEEAKDHNEVKTEVIEGSDDVDISGKKLGLRQNGYAKFCNQIDEIINGFDDSIKYINLNVNIIEYHLTKQNTLESGITSDSPYIFKYKLDKGESWITWEQIVSYGKDINTTIEGGSKPYLLPNDLGRLNLVTLFERPFGYNQASRPKIKPKKRQLAYFEYNPGNGLLEGGIRVLIPSLDHYKKHGFKIGNENIASNEFMLVWDYNFIDSIRLFDPEVAVARIIDLIFNFAKPVISINYSQIVLNEMIKHIVDGVISMDDTQVNDCYFTFSNDDFNSMLRKAEKARRGFATNGYSYNANDILNDDTIQGVTAGDITTIPNKMRNIVATGKENEWGGGYEIRNLLEDIWHKLTYFLVEVFFSPKVMTVLAINMEFLGMDLHNIQSWDNMLTVMAKGIREVIIKIKDALINWLLSYITTELTKLMEQVMSYLAIEQLRTYWDILTNLMTLVKKYFKIHGPLGVNDKIENVAFADIQKPTQEISTDANNNKC